MANLSIRIAPATRATTANPLRDIRHVNGFHKRIERNKVGKGSYTRQAKHKGRHED